MFNEEFPLNLTVPLLLASIFPLLINNIFEFIFTSLSFVSKFFPFSVLITKRGIFDG